MSAVCFFWSCLALSLVCSQLQTDRTALLILPGILYHLCSVDDWLQAGLEWSWMWSRPMQFPACVLPLSSRLVWVYSNKDGRVARAELHKLSTYGPSLDMTHCHFYQTLVAKASCKISQDLRHREEKFTFLWEELQSHTAKNTNTRRPLIVSFDSLHWPRKLTKEKIWMYHEKPLKGWLFHPLEWLLPKFISDPMCFNSKFFEILEEQRI